MGMILDTFIFVVNMKTDPLRYRGSLLPVVSLDADSQAVDFSGAPIVLFQWVLQNPSNIQNELSNRKLASKV